MDKVKHTVSDILDLAFRRTLMFYALDTAHPHRIGRHYARSEGVWIRTGWRSGEFDVNVWLDLYILTFGVGVKSSVSPLRMRWGLPLCK